MTVPCYGVRQSVDSVVHWITDGGCCFVFASCPVSPGRRAAPWLVL